MDATQADEKEKIRITNLNKEAFEELIWSIDTSTAAGKVTFLIIKRCNTKNYPNENAQKDWKWLCDKYIDKGAPTLIKIKRKFANSRLKKNTKDPDEWITELEELRDRLEDMHTWVTIERK